MTAVTPQERENIAALDPGPGPRPGRLRRIRVQPGLALSILVLLIVAAWIVVPGLFTSQDPIVGNPLQHFLPPSGAHWFGTDDLGRDQYTRVVYGTVHTMQGAATAILIGLVTGSVLGLLAATAGRAVESVIMRIVDVLLALPGLLLALCIVSAVGPGTDQVAIGIGVASIAPFARLMRSEVLRVRESEFVEAAYLSGSRYWRTLLRHILPNAAGAVLALVAVEFGGAILAIAALGFLGYGTVPPTPEWGTMVAEARDYLATAWWLTVLPGVVVIIVVLSFNRVSRAILDRGRL